MRVIDYQKVDLSDQEFAAYQELVGQLGEEAFKGLISTDDRGIITMVKPNRVVSWAVVFFLQQCMINQHLRLQDQRIDELQHQLDLLSNKVR